MENLAHTINCVGPDVTALSNLTPIYQRSILPKVTQRGISPNFTHANLSARTVEKPPLAQLMQVLSAADFREVQHILQGYTTQELQQGLPALPLDRRKPFSWVQMLISSDVRPLTRSEYHEAIGHFFWFFRHAGFPALHFVNRVTIPISSRSERTLSIYDRPSLNQSVQVNLTLQWNSGKWLQWWPYVPNVTRTPFDMPVLTSVRNGRLIGPPHLLAWIQQSLLRGAPSGKVVHAQGGFSFNYSITLSAPDSPDGLLPFTPPIVADSLRPFEFYDWGGVKRRQDIPDEALPRAVDAIDQFFCDGYNPRTRFRYSNAQDRLVWGSLDRDWIIDLFPGSNAVSNITLHLGLYIKPHGQPATAVSWWPERGGVLRPYDTPVRAYNRTARQTMRMYATLRDYVHERILGGYSRSEVLHMWETTASIGFSYTIVSASRMVDTDLDYQPGGYIFK